MKIDNRLTIIEKSFTNIQLNKHYLNLYYVRTSIFKAFQENIEKLSGTLLDVGCGIMPYREYLLENNSKITSYVGLDFESSVYPEYALGKPDKFWKGDVIPMGNNTIDSIIATEFFEHCPNPESIMKEMIRVLKPGGILFLTVPFLWNLHIVPYDEYRYTPFSLKRHLANADFTNISLKALGGTDASLAQMMGIWLQERPIRPLFKKILTMLFIPIMKMLIRRDSKNDRGDLFGDGSMITGLSGIAYKKF